MISDLHFSKKIVVAMCSMALLSSCIHHKYETPIAKNTQQPDKILFDQAMHDIEHGRYEVARISLQTLMNTYESSEYLAKAKLAIADSWFREGGANGLAQAEAEYKDFELFYPNMEESAEAQNRVCEIHFKQMEKSDRDPTQALRAETECRQLLVQYPNSKFAPKAQQYLRNIQESLAEHEFVVGNFYWKRDMNPAAANRLSALVDQYPLYSKADEALYEAGDSYSKMGPRFRKQSGEMFARLVREYPLGDRADAAKKRLEDMELPVPQADGAALARMKFEQENYQRPGLLARTTSFMRGGPDVSHAAKEGPPTMTDPKRTIPASIPLPANGGEEASATGSGAGTTEVTATTANTGALDQKPDARTTKGATQAATPEQPLPSNNQKAIDEARKRMAKKQKALAKKKKKPEDQNQAQPAASSTAPVNTASSPNQLSAPNAATSGSATTATNPAPQTQPQ